MKKRSKILALILAAGMLASGVCSTATTAFADSAATVYTPPDITEHQGGYDRGDRKLVTHAYDFAVADIGYYAADAALAMDNRGAGRVADGVLTVKDGMSFSFGSAVCLGDDYGLEEGYLTFDLCLKGGKAVLGARTSRTACKTDARGLWFEIDGSDKMRIYEPLSGLEASVAFPYDLTEAKTFTLHEGLDTLTLSCGDSVVASISYVQNSLLAIKDATGSVVAETTESDLYVTGYWQITMDDMDGYVDNVKFTNVEVDQTNPTTDELRLIDYSTWTATDDLERTVADAKTAGEPQANRYVGVFYFLCWVGQGLHVVDNTDLYLTLGVDGLKDYFNSGKAGEHYWAEPYFGYYFNTDTWVYRKHAYMLEQAGVDFIYLDVSNAEVFVDGHMALFDTWLQMRNEGIDTPQIVFFNGDDALPGTFQSNMKTLFTTVYSDDNWEKYEELFFLWEGKPLVFGNPSGLSGSTKTKVEEKFTVRGNWAWMNEDNYWSWLQEYSVRGNAVRMTDGGWGRNAEGKYESLSVALGHHAASSKGRSYESVKGPNNKQKDFEFSSIERAGQGICFAYQYDAVTKLVKKNVAAEDPFVMLITGWNEWIAPGFYREEGTEDTFCNVKTSFYYVDNFNAEFSRDAEPMRNKDGYGFGDNYYYQMVDYIRKFKGIDETPTADNQTTVSIYDLSTWDGITQTYMDSLYDVAFRNARSYDADNRYINNTGRNDFDYAKVSQDDNNLYFLVKCADDIIIDNGDNWMNLFINTDGDTATGWEGYDYVLNRDRDSYVVTVEKFKDNTFESEVVGAAYYALQGEYMTVRLPKELVGIDGLCQKLIFKWADNSVQNGDPMAFMDLGDAAPDNRFGFVYLCESVTTTKETAVVFAEGEQTATPNGTVVSGAADNINITVSTNDVDVNFDMESEMSGVSITKSALAEYFEFCRGTGISSCQIVKAGKNKTAMMMGYVDLRTWNAIRGDYSFSVDLSMADGYTNNVFIRGEMPGALTPTNPANHNITQVFNYYEWDWYQENGGTQGISSVGGSGIGITLGAATITILVKQYAPDGLTVTASRAVIKYPENFELPADKWVTLSCEDDGETAKVYLEGQLLFTATMSNPGVIYESDGTGQEYYGSCVITDAAGKERLNVTDTRLNSTGSQIAFATRNQNMEFDNLHITYSEQVANGGCVEEALTVQGTVAYTPADNLRTTLNLGTDLPSSGDDVVDGTDTDTDTEGTVTDTNADTEAETSGGKTGGCKSSLVSGSAVVLIAAAAASVLRKKRED